METEAVQYPRARLERFTFMVGADGMAVHEEQCADMNAPEFCAFYNVDARDMMAAIAIDTEQNAVERPAYTIHVCLPKRSRTLRLVSRLQLPKSAIEQTTLAEITAAVGKKVAADKVIAAIKTTLKPGSIKVEA